MPTATLLIVTSLLISLSISFANSCGANTLLLSLGSCLLAVPLGTLLALLLTRTDLPGRRAWLALFMLLMFVPLYLQAAAWDAGFGRMGWQGNAGRNNWLTDRRAVIWSHGVAGLPWVVVIVSAAMWTVNSAAEEAALLAGSKWQVLRHITLHRVAGAVLLASLWVGLTVATESMVADIYAVPTFARDLFAWASGLRQQLTPWQIGLGMSLLCLLALGSLMLLTRFAPREPFTPTRRQPRFALGRSRPVWLLLVTTVVAATTAVPLGNLVWQAGEESFTGGNDAARVWSVGHFVETVALTIRRFSTELRWTVVIGVAAATLSCLISVPLAWAARRRGLGRVPAVFVIVMGLGVPAPLLAESVIWLLNRDDPALLVRIVGQDANWFRWFYDRSILAPTLAVGLRCLPATTMVMWFTFQSVAKDQLEEAMLDGAGPLRQLARIAIPQCWLSLAAGWWIGFAVASGDVSASILVMPPGIDTISLRVFGLLHAGVDEQVAGLCLVGAVGHVLVGALIYHLLSRWIGQNGAEPKRTSGL